MNRLTAEDIKELRIVVGKAVGHDGPYTWGIDDYVAVGEHFKAKGLKQAESLVHQREREIVAELQRLREDAKILFDLGEDTAYNQGRIDAAHCLEQRLQKEKDL